MEQISRLGTPISARRRFTIAEINAGVSWILGASGQKLRLIYASAISIGGAAAAVTTVDLTGTQNSSTVKLVAWAQASLAQSTELRSGASGATILADGASYAPCDANTGFNVSKTGSDVTTATHIDIIAVYAAERP